MADPRDDIGAFLSFMAAQGAANLVAGRRGADEDAVARFAARAPWPLPPLYRGFLEEFGAHADGVCIGGDGSPRLADVAEFADTSPDEVPARSVVIVTPAIDAAYVLHRGDDGGEPTVCRAWSDRIESVVAPSFAHHLYRAGWRCAHWPNREDLTVRMDLADVARYARAIGLERLWFSGAAAACFDGGDACVDLERTGDLTRIHVLGRLARAREKYARAFVRKTGARWLGRA